MRPHEKSLGVVPPSVVMQATPTDPNCTQIKAAAMAAHCGRAMKGGAPASTIAACKGIRSCYVNKGCHRAAPIMKVPTGMGDLTPGMLLMPYNPIGLGDLVNGQLLEPYNPFGLGCAACDRAGMGDLTAVMTDLSQGNFSQAWTDLNAAAT